jgi:3-hydroxy-9,10-secoandrosta-1,3,5(10)-triene-9,17-dione monooxygenase
MTTYLEAQDATSTAQSPDGHDELVRQAAGLRAELWAHAHEFDKERRLTDAAVALISDAGLMRLLTPARAGGHEAGLRTYLDVVTELGRGSCSAAWVTGNLNAGNFMVSFFPPAARDEVWAADPDARTAFYLGRPVMPAGVRDGGVLLTGEWPYFSGCLHAQWLAVLIVGGPDPDDHGVHVALLSADEITIKDTWFFAGMRGTGSNTVAADRVFVPSHRIMPFARFADAAAAPENIAGGRPRSGLAGLFVGLLGALIGGTDSALAYVLESGPRRPVAASTYQNQAQSPTFQLAVADAAEKLDTAVLCARRIADTVDELAAAQSAADVRTRTRSRMDAAFVAQQCRDAMDLLMTAYGSSAFSDSCPLQRIWSDVQVGSRHAAFGMGIPQQVYGRALAGMDPRQVSFLD